MPIGASLPMLQRHKPALPILILSAALIMSGCTATKAPEGFGASVAPVQSSAKLNTADARVVLMPLDVWVVEITAAGLKETKADWTMAARANMVGALRSAMSDRGLFLQAYHEPTSDEQRHRDDQLRKLHSKISSAILDHHYSQTNRLPSKHGRLDWTLGPIAQQMGDDQNATFALFVDLRAVYADAGRNVAMPASIMTGDLVASPPAAGPRIGSATLVDLRTGRILWFNAVFGDPGDMREAATAREAVKLLLSGFPT